MDWFWYFIGGTCIAVVVILGACIFFERWNGENDDD